MIIVNIPADKHPTLAHDGSLTFAGVIQKYFTVRDVTGQNVGFSRTWKDEYAKQYFNHYVRRILPVVDQLFGNQKPMHEYRKNHIEAILAELLKKMNYADSSMDLYRRLILRAYNMGVLQNEYPDGVLWDIPDEDEDGETEEQNRVRILTKLRKSFSIAEELRMLRWFCSLDPETATGEEIALAMMYFLGLRDNEACGASFSSFELMKAHPDMALFTMSNTTSISSNQLKASGKTSNAPRQLPVCMPLFRFIKTREAAVQRKLNEDQLELPEGISSVNMLPVVCRGQRYTCRSDTQYVSKAGRKLFKQIGITDSEIKWLYDILLSEDFQNKVIEEKDPTPYMLRRNVATRLYHSGLSAEDTRYWIAHDIESVHIRRNYYADEENLYELGKVYLGHPLFAILDAMLNDVADANEEPGGMVRFHLDADKLVIVEVEAREPNMPVYIAAKSEAPFSLVQTAKETNKSPGSLVSIDYVLRNAYWRAYIQMRQNDDNSKEGQ